jgi:ubiquinone/menaquinone biosynthesis C-methylase UbiE
MNARHSKLTDWGLSHISIEERETILDVGCGGGRTLSKLASKAPQGKLYGIDHSQESVAASRRTNAHWTRLGRAQILHGSVSELPFPEGMFDLVTAVETHFWWPNLLADMREILRVLKVGGRLLIIAEVYKGANTMVAKLAKKSASRTGMALLSVAEHDGLFSDAGYSYVQIIEERDKGMDLRYRSKTLTIRSHTRNRNRSKATYAHPGQGDVHRDAHPTIIGRWSSSELRFIGRNATVYPLNSSGVDCGA